MDFIKRTMETTSLPLIILDKLCKLELYTFLFNTEVMHIDLHFCVD